MNSHKYPPMAAASFATKIKPSSYQVKVEEEDTWDDEFLLRYLRFVFRFSANAQVRSARK
jgi:hypothetical protein